MTDILIHMEKPRDCGKCFVGDRTICAGGCPLIELPEHGDLIDRDALLAEYERDERAADEHGREFSFSFDSGGTRCTEWRTVQQKLMDAPVVVPSNKKGD